MPVDGHGREFADLVLREREGDRVVVDVRDRADRDRHLPLAPQVAALQHEVRDRVVVGIDAFDLRPGDSLTFPSSTPHRLSNEGDATVRAIWVVSGRRGAREASER